MSLTSLKNYKGIDPFKHSVTLASACNLVFRALYLKKDTIPLLPAEGFIPKKRQSVKSLKWLHYMSKKLDCKIQYEYKIGGHHVDGYCKEKNIVLEYNGCAVHGHVACFNANVQSPFSGKSMGQLYQESKQRIKNIKESPQKPEVIEMWECQFDAELKNKKSDAYKYAEEANVSPVLSPRDAFFGGRCNAFKLYHECDETEQILYRDFCSMYPFINRVCRYGIGEVTVIRENFETIDSYFGLAQCVILPPKSLYLPLLPCKPNGKKLVFTLCRKCAELEQQTPCRHSDIDRSLRGVWVTEELKKAVSLGYKILKMEEVWHFKKTTQYDPKTKRGGLFAKYIETFLKVKQESSGFPEGVVTDEQKEKYISDYFKEEGIRLVVMNQFFLR